MSRAADKPPAPPAALRPTLVDYVFLLAGVSLSLYLMLLSPLAAEAGEGATTALALFVAFLPGPMRLSEGVILLWPFFLATQRLRGRKEGLTAAEWLWVLSWIGVAVLTLLGALDTAGGLPEFLQRYAAVPRKLWYYIFAPSMAALAVVLGLAGLVRRGPPPWTHTFGLAVILWPVVPLAGILALGASLK
jgi:hypothetical protein